MEATYKAPGIDAFLTSITGGKDRASCVRNGLCMTCEDAKDLAFDSFKDDLSRQEYMQSGMCQACQNAVFNSPGGTD